MIEIAKDEVGKGEEDFDGLDAGEDLGSGSTDIKPWDPKKIRITTRACRQLSQMAAAAR
jgi:hypothetical protein